MRSLLDRPLIITIGKDQSSSVSGCDLPKFDPWGEEIVKFVDHMWVVGSDNLIICLSSHPAVQAQCSSTQETLLKVEFNKLLVDHRLLDRLQLSRDQVNCYYKYIKWLDESHSYTFEEESTYKLINLVMLV